MGEKIITCLAIGFVFLMILLPTPTDGQRLIDSLAWGEKVTIKGMVSEDPVIARGYQGAIVDVAELKYSGKTDHHVNIKVWLKLKKTPTLNRYNKVQIAGVLKPGFGPFGATLDQANLVSVSVNPRADPLGGVRENFANRLKDNLTDEQTALGMGILAGQKSELPEDIKNAFIVASLTHILVASGYNLTILTRFVRRYIARYSRLVALILSISLVILFAQLVGLSASMERAVVVTILSLVTWYFGRNIHPVTLLSLAAAWTVLMDPINFRADMGWYLSFASFAGVLLLAPLINHLLGIKKTDETRKQRASQSIMAVVVETISAQLVAWPVIALVTHQVSVVGILANVLVLPIIPLAMLVTFLTGLTGGWLAVILGLGAGCLLDYILRIAEWLADLPFSSLTFTPTPLWVGGYYIALILIGWIIWRQTGHNFREDNVVE